MTVAIEEVTNYVFHTLKFHKILAVTHQGNQNSTKILTKFNFIKNKEADSESHDFNIYTLSDSI